jgi:hypothetical protein
MLELEHGRCTVGRTGDSGRGGAARCGARAIARKEGYMGCREGLMACMQARWLGRLGLGRVGAARGPGDGVRTVRPDSWQRGRAGVRACG